jgi:hypothetical protein
LKRWKETNSSWWKYDLFYQIYWIYISSFCIIQYYFSWYQTFNTSNQFIYLRSKYLTAINRNINIKNIMCCMMNNQCIWCFEIRTISKINSFQHYWKFYIDVSIPIFMNAQSIISKSLNILIHLLFWKRISSVI